LRVDWLNDARKPINKVDSTTTTYHASIYAGSVFFPDQFQPQQGPYFYQPLHSRPWLLLKLQSVPVNGENLVLLWPDSVHSPIVTPAPY
jgi:hypothetical protein